RGVAGVLGVTAGLCARGKGDYRRQKWDDDQTKEMSRRSEYAHVLPLFHANTNPIVQPIWALFVPSLGEKKPWRREALAKNDRRCGQRTTTAVDSEASIAPR